MHKEATKTNSYSNPNKCGTLDKGSKQVSNHINIEQMVYKRQYNTTFDQSYKSLNTF